MENPFKKLKQTANRVFIIYGNTRDKVVLNDGVIVNYDYFLYYYLKEYLKYNAVVFVDCDGLYFFSEKDKEYIKNSFLKGNQSQIKSSPQISNKLLSHSLGITTKKKDDFKNNLVIKNSSKLRITYNREIAEIVNVLIDYFKKVNNLCIVIYDSTIFQKINENNNIFTQWNGFLKTEIYKVQSSNIIIFVESEELEEINRKFSNIGMEFLFEYTLENRQINLKSKKLIYSGFPEKDEVYHLLLRKCIEDNKIEKREKLEKLSSILSGFLKKEREGIRVLCDKNFEEIIEKVNLNDKSGYKELKDLIGMKNVKKEIKKILKGIEKNKKSYERTNILIPNRFNSLKKMSLPDIPHLVLMGSPGTGKTTVAKIIGKILREEGLLDSGHLVKVTKKDLVGEYVGSTPIKTRKKIEEALEGVLFIDEAYSLYSDSDSDFGREAINELIEAMTDYKGRIMMIFAGYPNEMEKFIKLNPGFESRITRLYIDEYTERELSQIGLTYIKKNNYKISQEVEDNFENLCKNILHNREKFGGENFGNARIIIKLIDNAEKERKVNEDNIILPKHFYYNNMSLEKYFFEVIEDVSLEKLIGLKEVKKRLKNIYKRLKISKTSPGHFIFIGNPGTGKTEVAKLMAKEFYKLGILKSANFIGKSATELIGKYVGETENKINELLKKSIGGVLFIDEAHQLAQEGRVGGFRNAVINAIVPFMENHRDEFSLILAGYPDEMEKLLQSDPGLKSRFPTSNIIKFEDYNEEELFEIFKLFLSKKSGYKLDVEKNKHILLDCFSRIKKADGKLFGNARSVRNFLELIIDKALERYPDDFSEKVIELKEQDIFNAIKEYESK